MVPRRLVENRLRHYFCAIGADFFPKKLRPCLHTRWTGSTTLLGELSNLSKFPTRPGLVLVTTGLFRGGGGVFGRNKIPDGAERGIVLFSGRPPRKYHFRSFSGRWEPSEVGDYKKAKSKARTATMSIESLLHCAIYGERTAGNG